jgi:hypothetical protein
VSTWAQAHGYGKDATVSDKNQNRTPVAPEIVKVGNTYYLYYSLVKEDSSNESAIFCVKTNNLKDAIENKEWTDVGLVISSCGTNGGTKTVTDEDGNKTSVTSTEHHDAANAVHPSVVYEGKKLYMAYGGYYGNDGYDNARRAPSDPRDPRAQGYRQPAYGQQPSYNQYNGYQPSPALKPQGKSVGALVIYMICGAMALLSILFVFLPHLSVIGRAYAPFQLVSDSYVWGSSSDARVGAVFVIILLVIPMLLQLVWAILSFLRTRAAGVLGLIASIFAINHTIIWLALLAGIRERSYSLASMTAVPVLMLIFAIAGMVLAIIQMTKKNRVR